MQRRRDQRISVPTEQAAQPTKPVNARADDAEMKAGLNGVMKDYQAACPPNAPAAVTPAPAKGRTPQPRAAILTSAIRSSVAMPRQRETESFRAELLRQSALCLAGAQAGMHHSSG
jgi:hypothetical protein